MLFDEMCQIARNIVSQRMNNNIPISFNDTVCVAYTVSGKVYTGVSSIQQMNGFTNAIHAEIELCGILANENDTAVAEMTLVNAGNFQPIMPCPMCASQIMNLNPMNVNTVLLFPGQNVPLSQAAGYMNAQYGMGMNPNMGMMPQYPNNMGNMNAQYGMGMGSQYMAGGMTGAPQGQYAAAPTGGSVYMNTPKNATESVYLGNSKSETDDGSYMRNRLNKLLSGDEEEDDSQTEDPKAAKKNKFKIF